MIKVKCVSLSFLALLSFSGLTQNNPFDGNRNPIKGFTVGESRFDEKQLLEFSDEQTVSLSLRHALVEMAKLAGVKINSISTRKSKRQIGNPDRVELRIYCGYDASLSGLITFFESMQNHETDFTIQTLNVSARRQPVKDKTSQTGERRTPRAALNGNMVLSVQGLSPAPEGSMNEEKSKELVRNLEPHVFYDLVDFFSDALPAGAFLTQLKVKMGNVVQVQGEADEPFQIRDILSESGFLEEVKPADAFTSRGREDRSEHRFVFKATIASDPKPGNRKM